MCWVKISIKPIERVMKLVYGDAVMTLTIIKIKMAKQSLTFGLHSPPFRFCDELWTQLPTASSNSSSVDVTKLNKIKQRLFLWTFISHAGHCFNAAEIISITVNWTCSVHEWSPDTTSIISRVVKYDIWNAERKLCKFESEMSVLPSRLIFPQDFML